jgi:hypothetical protein
MKSMVSLSSLNLTAPGGGAGMFCAAESMCKNGVSRGFGFANLPQMDYNSYPF